MNTDRQAVVSTNAAGLFQLTLPSDGPTTSNVGYAGCPDERMVLAPPSRHKALLLTVQLRC